VLRVAEYVAAAVGALLLHLLLVAFSLDTVISRLSVALVRTNPYYQFSLAVIGLAIVTRIVISTTKDRQGLIDPKVWFHDRDTGEYYPITGTRGSSITYQSRDYGKRSVEWFERAGQDEEKGLGYSFGGLLLVAIAKGLEFSGHLSHNFAMMLWLCGLLSVWYGAWRWATAERGRWKMVGPPPAPFPLEKPTNKTGIKSGLSERILTVEQEDLERVIAARFPPSDIFRVPRGVLRYLSDSDIENMGAGLREDDYAWWKWVIDKYPSSPKNVPEREAREEDFWEGHCHTFTMTDPNQRSVLKPRQEIDRHFMAYEKWIFREYFAATGSLPEKTIMEKIVNNILDSARAHAMNMSGSPSSPKNAKRNQEIEKAENIKKQLEHDIIPAHYKKWSEWYFFYIKQAFNKRYGVRADLGPSSAETTMTPEARDRLRHKPNT
jgi:hypothetical protein